MTGTGQMICLKPMMRQPLYFFERMIYRMKNELERTPIEGCMGGNGTVWMEKLLTGQEEMMGKGRAYVRHTLNPGVSIGIHTHEGEMETMVIVRGKAVHTINGQDQYLEEGDIIAAQPGDSHGIAQTGDEPLVLIAQVLFA
mgnify:FL=1